MQRLVAQGQESVYELQESGSGVQNLNNYTVLEKQLPLIFNYTEIYFTGSQLGEILPPGTFGNVWRCSWFLQHGGEGWEKDATGF